MDRSRYWYLGLAPGSSLELQQSRVEEMYHYEDVDDKNTRFAAWLEETEEN